MKIAIMSDIHSNFEALKTALDYCSIQKIDRIICLGDIIGYGPNPIECIELVKQSCQISILGNHDAVACDRLGINSLNSFARKAMDWTKKLLTFEHIDWLNNLPYMINQENSVFVHASPHNPEQWTYLTSPSEAALAFKADDFGVCFIGHTHIPGIISENLQSYHLKRGNRYIVNVGSIGQPRDGDPRLCFCVFDNENWKTEHIRLDYDYSTTQKKIIDAGLPKPLAERLASGY